MAMLIRNVHGEQLATSFVHGVKDRGDLVVIGHGLTSNKDRPWSEMLSCLLADHGIASLRVAWSGNGASEGAFVESTISKEVSDLGSVLDAVAGKWRVSYVGHSMGAAVGVLRAVADPRIHSLVSLAGMVHTAEFVKRMFGHLQPGDFLLDKPHCPLGASLLNDLNEIETVAPFAAQIRVPWLVVHGDADDVVPVSHSRDICAAASGKAHFVELDDVDHSFTGAGLEQMTDRVVPWICERFAQGDSFSPRQE